jgi:hypothetical protein
MKRRSFGKRAMTGVEMKRQFRLWLVQCVDKRLIEADTDALQRMYGVRPDEARAAIAEEISKRGLAA